MRRGLLLAISLALGCLAAPLAAQIGRLAATLDEFREHYGFPGATAATGPADVQAGRAMTPLTPMLAASIGKSFVAATVLTLEDEGWLSRDDLLSIHLGDRPWFEALHNAGTITVDHLLHHTSGLPDHVHLSEFQAEWTQLTTDGEDFDTERLTTFVAGGEPLFEASQAWAYSDMGYVLLGLVIEDVTGQTWQEAVRTRPLDRLDLGGTIPSNRPDLPGLAVGYVAPDNPFGLPARTADAEGRLLWNPAVESAGGGFASTSPDLAPWGHLLFGGEAMDAPCLDRLLDGVPVAPDAPGILYGAGVPIYADTPRGPVYGHGGWISAYVSSLRHYAGYGVTVAFQINTDVGVMDDSSDFVPALEAALADLAIEAVR